MNDKKVFLLGIDGARLNVIKKWADEGHLPFFKKIINNGVSGDLRTIFPPHSMLAWTSLQTGKNPGKHGLYNTVLKSKNSYKHFVPNANNIKGANVFDYLTDKYECCSINLPVTYPPRNKDMITISAWLAPPLSEYVYPKKISEKVKSLGYKIQPDSIHKNANNFISEVYSTTNKRFELSEYLIKNYNLDFLTLVLTGSEHLHHNYASFIDPNHPNHNPSDEELVRKYYSYLDTRIEKLYADFGDNVDLIVVSDHGFAPSYGIIYLNNILSSYGYFKPKRKRSVSSFIFKFLEESGLANKLRNKIEFDIFGLLPESIENFVKEERGITINADWENTEAFCSGILGDIRINLEGRESNGIVKKNNYDKLRETIIENLWKDERISKFIEDIYKKEEIFEGPSLNEIPDLFVKFKKQIVSSAEIPRNKFFNPERKLEGFHTMNGIFLAYGPRMSKNKRITNAKIIDIAPTILHLFERKIPRDMDGKVLKIFKKGSPPAKKDIDYCDPIRKETSKKEGDQKIKKRLEELGYLS